MAVDNYVSRLPASPGRLGKGKCVDKRKFCVACAATETERIHSREGSVCPTRLQENPLCVTNRRYQMGPGDTLWTVAAHFYGKGDAWNMIYQANRNKIANPNNVPAGTILELP